MQSQFKAISISHKTAPLGIREGISLNEEECGNLLRKLLEVSSISEALVLSTCNRTEIYYSSTKDQSDLLIKLLCIERDFESSKEITPYFKVINNQHEAIKHLFYVSIGLESQVVGDLQITNQVKRAYQLTADLQAAGPFLHRLLHTIFFTNKRVVQETAFRDGAASVSYAAVELVEELTFDKADPKVLVVGLGEIGADVVRNLQHTHIKNIKLTNRTFAKAEALAKECEYEAVPFENVWEEAANADVVISAVSGHEPFFTKQKVEALNILSYKIFIDLSVPRSVAKNVEDVTGTIVHNVDDINNRATQALERRKESIPSVKNIIAQSIEEFNEWSKEMIFSPTIQKLKGALEQIRKEEMDRFMKQMNEDEAEKIEKITKSMMNKIIKLPVLQLKAACKRGEAETLVDLLNDLFNLEAASETSNSK